MRIRAAVFGALLCLAGADASAQTCVGLPSFSQAPYQASAGMAFAEGVQAFGGGGALGSENIFIGGTLAFTSVDAADATATSFGAQFGAPYVLSERERIEVCPVGSVIVTSGPDLDQDGVEVDVSGVGLRGGGRMGLVAFESGNVEVVPTFGLDIAYDRVKAETGTDEATVRDTYVIVRAGVGFVLNRNLAVVPALSVPLGVDDSDPEFSFVVAYQFGQR
jgi:hypothetical protein